MSTSSDKQLGPTLAAKLDRCRQVLRELGSVAVGVSGGADSACTAALAAETLGPANVLAVHATGPLFPRHERAQAQELARRLGVRMVEIAFDPFSANGVAANAPDRCYHCKQAIFGRVLAAAREAGLNAVASGTNADDVSDYRPGLRAEGEMHIRRPLLEAGITKAEVRQLLAARGLEAWDLPSAACLASRVPYGTALTPETLARIDEAEARLRGMGFAQLRVRDHGDVARIELPADDLPTALARREEILAAVRPLGYAHVALDLAGFRSGSMNVGVRKSK